MKLVPLALAVIALAGCATANTAAQDRTYAAIEACKALQPSGYQVTRVNTNGTYRLYGGDWAGGREAWMACIQAGGPK
jgi:hypothetical protein